MVKDKQPLLLLDYLHGHKKLKGEFKALESVSKAFQRIRDHPLLEDLDFYKLAVLGSKKMNSLEVSGQYVVSSRVFGHYFQNKGKNYVFGRELSKALESAKLTVKPKYLPTSFCHFIYIPERFLGRDAAGELREEVLGYFVDISPQSNTYMLTVIKFKRFVPTGELSWGILSQELDHSSNLDLGEYITRKREEYQLLRPESTFVGSHTFRIDDLRYVLNCVLYISGKVDIGEEEINTFSTKRSKREHEQKQFTTLPFVRVGFNFQSPRLHNVSESAVDSFYRWQACGTNWSEHKLIIVMPHTRVYKHVKKGALDVEQHTLTP